MIRVNPPKAPQAVRYPTENAIGRALALALLLSITFWGLFALVLHFAGVL